MIVDETKKNENTNMSNEEQCFVLLILQVINFLFLLTSAFFKALKGFFLFISNFCLLYLQLPGSQVLLGYL